ncbi:TPA: hypothetical protein L3H12_002535 [Acinetobacter baumannii]|uniref:hypothetical protein n=1 Tax=Acinetobacter baumannii TaxID=470 RepID=UPI00041BDD64|nr:hypothetical protein [Acinetobacter baumannii]RSP32460.1 hypothetical protein EA730_09180 [Acinetobacter baumannii]HBN5965802.1 hypothetical protein [Acinetobacter baumannii]
MPQYLMFAENIYKKVKDEQVFSDDRIENMNTLMKYIRSEIEGTEFKLKYNFIDFMEQFSTPLDECKVKIDVSLIPHYNLKDEYILWLAGFIEKITEGGPKPPPPIKKFIPEFMSLKSELDFLPLNEEKVQNEGKEIMDYFNSKLYKSTFKK